MTHDQTRNTQHESRSISNAFYGQTIVILGLARQGEALARFAARAGARVIVSDLRPFSALREVVSGLADLEIEFVLGEHPMTLLDEADLLAISGGVPADAPLVEEARRRGIPVTNDSAEFMRRTPAAVVGITGSAGKTTTTALTGVMGQVAGRRTWVGGNIGRPLIADLHKMTAEDLVVQELSSFQLELWEQSPPVAAVLNITPNHLDRHKTMEAYTAAKANVIRYQSEDDVAVLNVDDPGAMSLASQVTGRLRTFSLTDPVEDGAFLREEQVWLRNGRETAVLPLAEIPLRGRHNVANVLAAVALADTVGISPDAMAEAIRTFGGVEHRLEHVATSDGVAWFNDSIATAPERALAALAAFDAPIVLLAGGKDKDMVWEEWARRVAGRVKSVVLFGELAETLAEMLAREEYTAVAHADSLADAVEIAGDTAVAGDVILLSPGGTSYDAFPDFAARGEAFRQLVKEWQRGKGQVAK